MRINRRQFLGRCSGAMIVAGAAASGPVFGANNRVRMAAVGVNGRGWAHAREVIASDNAELVALCDVDSAVLEARASEVKKLTGRTPAAYQDIRDLLADDGVDAVSFATPNHWHVLGSIWAMQAGKDVYCEKPISHTVWEGRQLAAAAKKYGRVLQHGTQRRSEPEWQRIVERARSGVIGDIYMVRCPIFRRRESFSYPRQEEPPDRLDWKLWQGPATEKPFSRNYVHYRWHWFWHYGNGEIGNNGPHRTDLANWILDKGLPVETYSTGGIFGYKEDARQTPNTQTAVHTFADGTILTIDVRNRFTNSEGGMLMLYGSEGHMADRTFYDKDDKPIPDDQSPPKVDASREHFAAFFRAVQNQDPAAVPANAEQGHVAAALCHLGNIAYRVGRSLRFDPDKERFIDDPEADKLLTREYRSGFEVPDINKL